MGRVERRLTVLRWQLAGLLVLAIGVPALWLLARIAGALGARSTGQPGGLVFLDGRLARPARRE